MKSHSSLLSMGNLTQSCLSRQVFQGSMRWTGGRKATVQGVKPSRQCSQPGSLNPGAALESDGRVNPCEHLQASSEERAKRGCFKAPAKTRPAVRFGLSNVARREWRTAGVESGPNPSCGECGTWKSCQFPPGEYPGKPTARQAQGRQHEEDRTSQGRSVMDRICPRRSGVSWQENQRNPFKREKHRTSDARRLVPLGAAAQRSRARYGRRPVLPSGIGKVHDAFGCHRPPGYAGPPHPGWPWRGLSRDEGKLSSPVLRGAWAGDRLRLPGLKNYGGLHPILERNQRDHYGTFCWSISSRFDSCKWSADSALRLGGGFDQFASMLGHVGGGFIPEVWCGQDCRCYSWDVDLVDDLCLL